MSTSTLPGQQDVSSALLSVETEIDLIDLSAQLSDVARGIFKKDPVLRRKKAGKVVVYGLWDRQEEEGEDFLGGLKSFESYFHEGETFAIGVGSQLVANLVEESTRNPSSLSPFSPNELLGTVTTTCMAGICPLSFDAKVRMHVSTTADGAVRNGTDILGVQVATGSLVCVVLVPDIFGFVRGCLDPLLSGSVGSVFDKLPREIDVATLKQKIDYVRVGADTNRVLVFGAKFGS